jgi:precorrin-2 methylase
VAASVEWPMRKGDLTQEEVMTRRIELARDRVMAKAEQTVLMAASRDRVREIRLTARRKGLAERARPLRLVRSEAETRAKWAPKAEAFMDADEMAAAITESDE